MTVSRPGADGLSLQTHVITDLERLEEVRPAWEKLALDSEHVSAFAAPGSVITWFQLVRGHSGIHVITVWRGSDLVGLAPFSAVYLGPFTLYSTAGAGFAYYGEALLGSDAKPVAQAIVEQLSKLVSSGSAAVYLRRLRSDGIMAQALAESPATSCRQMFADEANSVVLFDEMDDPDQYFEEVGRKHQIPRLTRRLGEQFDRVEYLADDPHPDEALDVMRDMLQRRFDSDLRIFATPQNRTLTYTLVATLVRTGNGRVCSLMADGRRITVAVGPNLGPRFTYYAVAYEPDLTRFSLGHLELYHFLRNARALGATEVDLGDARFAYKHKWANATWHYRTVAVTARGWRGSLAQQLRRLTTRRHRGRRLGTERAGPHVV